MGPPASTLSQSRQDRTVVTWLFVATTAFFLLIGNGITKAGDEASMREITRSLVDERSITVPDTPFIGVPGSGGRTVSKYGIGQSAAAVPFEVVGRAVSAPLDDPEPVREAAAVALVPFVMGALVASSYVLGRRLGGAPIDALGVAVIASLGSLNLVYGIEFFAEPLLGLLLLISVERASKQSWTWSFGALSAAMLVHARGAPLVAVLVVVAWRQIGWRGVLRSGWPVGVGVVGVLAYTYVRFGTLFESGYTDEGFTTPLALGIRGLLFDPSKSFLLFAPVAVAGLVALRPLLRTRPVAVQLIAGYATIVFLLDATWHSWMGGWSWGPRFLMPVAALLAIPLAPWLSADRRRWGAIGALGLVGFAVSLPAVIVPSTLQKDRAPTSVGPQVVEQYGLVPSVVESTARGQCSGTIAGSKPQDCTLAKWQVHVIRSVGPVGDVVVVGLSGVLLLLVGVGGRRAFGAALGADRTAASPEALSVSPTP